MAPPTRMNADVVSTRTCFRILNLLSETRPRPINSLCATLILCPGVGQRSEAEENALGLVPAPTEDMESGPRPFHRSTWNQDARCAAPIGGGQCRRFEFHSTARHFQLT